MEPLIGGVGIPQSTIMKMKIQQTSHNHKIYLQNSMLCSVNGMLTPAQFSAVTVAVYSML